MSSTDDAFTYSLCNDHTGKPVSDQDFSKNISMSDWPELQTSVESQPVCSRVEARLNGLHDIKSYRTFAQYVSEKISAKQLGPGKQE